MLGCIPDPNPNARGELLQAPPWSMCFTAIAVIVISLIIANTVIFLVDRKKKDKGTKP